MLSRFFPEFCIFQDLFNGEVRGIGREVEGLYYFPNEFSCTTRDTDNVKMMMTQVADSDCMLWHKRMGHPSLNVLRQLSLVDSQSVTCDACPICPLAK